MTRPLLLIFIFTLNCYYSESNSQNNSNTDHYLFTRKIDPWLILDTRESRANDNWFNEWTNNMSGIFRLGVIVQIISDSDSGELYIKLRNEKRYQLDLFLKEVAQFISEGDKQFTIIFYADYTTTLLINKYAVDFSKKIDDITLAKQATLYNILKKEKLSWFSKDMHNITNMKVHIFNDYFQEQTITKNKNYCPQVMSSQGSILYGLENIKQDTLIINKERAHFAERQLWLNAIFEHWNESSIQPVFLVMQSNTHIQSYKTAIRVLQKAPSVNVAISNSDMVPIHNIYWAHNNYNPSRGIFNFPINKTTRLEPYKPGFNFDPKEINLTIDKANNNITIKAYPFNIEDNLVLIERFNNSKQYQDILDNTGSAIIEDRKRGSVLQIAPNGEIPIGTIEEYDLSDNNFTISFWIKTTRSIDRDCNIIGNNTREHRKGLHLCIRADRPYFGFYYNDIWSNTRLKPRTWYQITCTYDKFLKQQRIYINGELDKVEQYRASFIGSGNLFVGRAININTTYPFLIDDLCIWNRTLGDDEIVRLQFGLIPSAKIKNGSNWLLAILLMFIGVIAYILWKRQKSREVIEITPDKKQINSILLFGDFTLIDNKGVDVTNCIPPMAKEMFILLLSAKFKDKKGVSSQEISSHFWSDLPTSKARNNRNVAIAKLRKCIKNIDGLSIEYENKLTFIKIESPCYCDYLAAINETKKLTGEQASSYFNIIKRGLFLPFTEWDWLSDLKSKINSEIIENLSILLVTPKLSKCRQMREDMCLHILSYDDLNQRAIFCLVQIYCESNRVNLATSLFQKYKNTYKKVYNEDYNYSFNKFRDIKCEELV